MSFGAKGIEIMAKIKIIKIAIDFTKNPLKKRR